MKCWGTAAAAFSPRYYFPEKHLGVVVMLKLAGNNGLARLQDVARIDLPAQ